MMNDRTAFRRSGGVWYISMTSLNLSMVLRNLPHAFLFHGPRWGQRRRGGCRAPSSCPSKYTGGNNDSSFSKASNDSDSLICLNVETGGDVANGADDVCEYEATDGHANTGHDALAISGGPDVPVPVMSEVQR
jgi:hypothetical protein